MSDFQMGGNYMCLKYTNEKLTKMWYFNYGKLKNSPYAIKKVTGLTTCLGN